MLEGGRDKISVGRGKNKGRHMDELELIVTYIKIIVKPDTPFSTCDTHICISSDLIKVSIRIHWTYHFVNCSPLKMGRTNDTSISISEACKSNTCSNQTL